MRIRSIKERILLFPGELEKWLLNKNDYIYIKSSGKIKICFDRITTEFTNKAPGLIQFCYGPFSIQNIDNDPVCLQGIQFSLGITMKRGFFTTDFDQEPFQAILTSRHSIETYFPYIINIVEKFKEKNHNNKEKDIIDPRLIQLNRYIRKNYSSQISLQDLADIAGVHPTYLSNTYSRVFNISPIYFINQLRMKKAKELLAQPHLSIKIIATSVGYGSLSQFSSIFKRFYSMSPSQYREEVIKKNT